MKIYNYSTYVPDSGSSSDWAHGSCSKKSKVWLKLNKDVLRTLFPGDGGTGCLKGDLNALTTLAGAIVDFLLIFDGVRTILDGVFILFLGDNFFGV